jgi:hypothetical protein
MPVRRETLKETRIAEDIVEEKESRQESYMFKKALLSKKRA